MKGAIEKAIDSLKEIKNEITDEELSPENIGYHLKKARNFVSILVWEIGKIADKIEKKRKLSNFEIQGDTLFPFIPSPQEWNDKKNSDEIEEALSLLLVNNEFSAKEWEKLVEYVEFYKAVKNEPSAPDSQPA